VNASPAQSELKLLGLIHWVLYWEAQSLTPPPLGPDSLKEKV